MAKIFISHAKENDTKARAIQNWLILHSWHDLFRAADERFGLKSGAEWQPRLVTEIEISKAMLCLISEAWMQSDECQKELSFAYSMGKIIFGVVVEAVEEGQIPKEVTSARQLTNLAAPRDHRSHTVVRPGGAQEKVTFSESGLKQLKAGLAEVGLDDGSFTWPPPNDPDRPPFRGMSPFEAEDAGIYFGRDGDIGRLLSRLSEAHNRGESKLIPILAASGTGKSSFLRAGILPRLGRDTETFLVFPLMRPLSAAISGQHGFEVALHAFGAKSETKIAKADVKSALAKGPEFVVQLFTKHCSANSPLANKTLVIAIDQAEELLRDDEDGENKLLMRILGAMLNCPKLRCVVLLCMRSDAHSAMQTAGEFGYDDDPFSFRVMPQGAYSAVIEGPALATKNSRRPFTIEPALTDRLLRDIDNAQSKDGLPLLALTLERLYRNRSDAERISLEDYELDGGIADAVEASVKNSFQLHNGYPIIKGDQGEKWDIVKRTFIPWLIEVDSESDRAFRRISSKNEIPAALHDVVDVLIDQRLLTVDASEFEGMMSGPPTIEITHEALIRQWPRMGTWIEENRKSLKAVDEVRRAATLWSADGRPTGRLVHSGEPLLAALKILNSEWRARFRPIDAEYVSQCDEAETQKATEKQRIDRRIRSLQRKGLFLALALSLILSAGLIYIYMKNTELTDSNARLVISAAARLFDDGRMEEGALLLLQALEILPVDQQPIGVRTGLQRYVDFTANSQAYSLPIGEVWKVRAPGIIIEDRDKSVLHFYASAGEAWQYKSKSANSIVALQMNMADSRLFLARNDGLLEVLDVKKGSQLAKFSFEDVENLTDMDVDLTTDGYAFVRLEKSEVGPSFYILNLSSGVSKRFFGETIEEVLQDGERGNIVSTNKGFFRVATEKNQIKLTPVKFTGSELAVIKLRSCFFGMGDDPADVTTDIDFASADLLASECRRAGDKVILSKTMWNSAGGKRSDTVKYIGNSDEYRDDDVKDRVSGWFGKHFTDQNISWLDQSESGYIGAIFNRDLFVFDDNGAVLNLRYGAGISWAAFSGDHFLSVVDTRLGIIRTYDLSRFSASDQDAEEEEVKTSSTSTQEITDASFSSCSGEHRKNYLYKDESTPGGKLEIRGIMRNAGGSSVVDISVAVEGRTLPLRVPEEYTGELCVEVHRNWPYLALFYPAEERAEIYSLDLLGRKPLASSDHLTISNRLSSLFVTSAGEMITTHYSHTVERWRLMGGAWRKDDLPLLTSDNVIQYAETSPSGNALLVIEDTGQRMLNGKVYALGDTPLFWKDLGREYKFLSASFLSEDTVVAQYNGSGKTFVLGSLPDVAAKARLALPTACMRAVDYAQSKCWPIELKPI